MNFYNFYKESKSDFFGLCVWGGGGGVSEGGGMSEGGGGGG